MNTIFQIYAKLNKSNLARSFTATLVGSGLSKVILALATFLFANELSKLEFGEFSFVRNTLNTILCMCALNFMSLCTKFTVESEKSESSLKRFVILFLFSIALCMIVGFTLLLLPDYIMVIILGSKSVTFFFRLIGLLLPLFMLQPLLEGVLRGLMKFKLIGYMQTITAILFVVFVYVGIKFNGLDGAICGILFYYSLYSILSLVVVFKLKPFTGFVGKIKSLRSESGVIRKMILPVFLMSFFEAPILWIAQVLLSKFDSMEAVGSMSAIFQLRNMMILIPSYMFNTFVAYAGKMNAEGQYRMYFKKFNQLSRMLVIIGLGFVFLCSVFSVPLLGLYGECYRGEYIPLILSNLEVPLLLLIGLWKIDLVIQEHQNQLLYSSFCWNVLWMALFIPSLYIGLKPLESFFITQLVAVLFYAIWLFIIFNNDKKRLIYEK